MTKLLRGLAAAGVVALLVIGASSPLGAASAPAPVSTVRVAFPQDDGTLTPYTFELGYPLVSLVYDTLLLRDEQGVPQPWLAERVDASHDGRTVTLRLREGVTWHDGRPFSSADVAFTLRFVKERPHPRFTPALEAVEQVDAPDGRTVRFRLRHPAPGFADQPLADLPMLPAHLWAALPPRQLAPDGLPVGTGPYRLTSYRPGAGYRFEANPGYFQGRPAIAAVEVPFIPTAEDMVRALERGDIDMVPVALPAEAAQRVAGPGVRVTSGDSYTGTSLLFDVRRPPFDSPAVRRAVAHALDLDHIARVAGGAVPANRGYVHPASRWAPPAPLHAFDERAARALLTAPAYAPVQVLAPANDPAKVDAGRQVVLALTRLGLTARLDVVPATRLAHAMGEDGSLPSFQAAIWHVPALASHDPDHLQRLFGSGSAAAASNVGGYRSASFDALAARIARTADPGARRVAVHEALAVLASDVPAVPLFFPAGRFAYRPQAHDGWRFVKGDGILGKRSFLPPAAEAGAPLQPLTGPRPAIDVEPVPASAGLPVGQLALALLAAAAALGALALVARRA